MSGSAALSVGGRVWRRAAALAGRHRLFLALLLVGVALRALVTLAYRPALFYTGDSYTYLFVAEAFGPDPQRPALYSAFLRPLLETGVLTLVPAVQHLLGLAVAFVVYTLVRRAGGAAWLGCLAAAPVLLDGLQVTLEHYLLTETLFQALAVAALATLVWRSRPSPEAAAAAGLLVAAATLTRTVGLVLVLPLVGYLVARRARPLAYAALLLAFALPVTAYAAWFESHWGRFHVTAFDGHFLYGRVGPFVDCRGLDVPPAERPLCAAADLPDQRPVWYVFAADSPLRSLPSAEVVEANEDAGRFARAMILHRPGAYLRAAGGDFLGYFRPERTANALQNPVAESALPPDRISYYDPVRAAATVGHIGEPGDVPVVDRGLARRLAAWQGRTWLPGPLLAVAALLALAAPFVRAAREHGRSTAPGALFVASALLLLALPSAAVNFDWRFVVPTLPLFGVAGALGLHALAPALVSARARLESGLARGRITRQGDKEHPLRDRRTP